MWGFHTGGWGLAMLLWMLFVWAAVLVVTWVVFRNIGGPRHHVHR